MKFWHQYPMARLLFPFVLGIILHQVYSLPGFLWLILFTLALSAWFLWSLLFNKTKNYSTRWLNGLFFNLTLLFLAPLSIQVNLPINRTNHYQSFSDASLYIIEITSSVSETEKSYKSLAKIKGVKTKTDSNWHVANGKIFVYFSKDDRLELTYGSRLLCKATINALPSAQNPNAFDYAKHMALKGIYHQIYLRGEDYFLLNADKNMNPKYFAFKLRDKLLSILNDLNFSQQNQAVAAAILLGYDEYLDPETRAQFSGSGAMHILCVSGLHVGIIFMIANVLFGFLVRIKYGKHLKTVLILLIIWIYAMITGLSPSVLRSATMFTFIIIGKTFRRSGNTYNSLAASAFVLLLLDPFLIFDIGFQLSYSAVFAILYLQPKFFQLLTLQSAILKKIWALITVSLAAQLGTFALAIYYFHQFPNYFLITNLWIIPLAFGVVCIGILVLILGLIGLSKSFAGLASAYVLKTSLDLLNWGVESINNLPYSILANLYFSKIVVLLVYALIFSLAIFLLQRKGRWLLASISVVLALIATLGIEKANQSRYKDFIIFNSSGNTVLDFISDQKSWIYTDSTFLNNLLEQKYVLQEHYLKNGIRNQIILDKNSMNKNDVYIQDKLILFDSLKLLLIDEKIERYYQSDKPLKLDFVVIANNAKVDLNKLLESYSFDFLIFDSSNNFWKINPIKEQAQVLGIAVWDVHEQGAFSYSAKKTHRNLRQVDFL